MYLEKMLQQQKQFKKMFCLIIFQPVNAKYNGFLKFISEI